MIKAQVLSTFELINFELTSGGLAQLARALDLHSRGQGFDSLILHQKAEVKKSESEKSEESESQKEDASK